MKYIKKIAQTNLFKISSLSGFSVILKIGIGLITSKLLAVFVGPNGMALVGNLRNFSASLESVSTLGFQNGVIKYVAENKENKRQFQKIISTVFVSLLFVALLLSGILCFFAAFWNKKIFGNNFEYQFVFKAMALALPWYAISIFFIAIINGLGQYKRVVWLNIIGNSIGLLVSVFMILRYQTLGALLAIVITPALLFFLPRILSIKKLIFLKV